MQTISNFVYPNGLRLRKEALGIRINGLNIGELSDMSIKSHCQFFENLRLDKREQIIVSKVLKRLKKD